MGMVLRQERTVSKTAGERWQGFKDRFNDTLDRIFPPMALGLQPAFAYAGAARLAPQIEPLNKPTTWNFDTGKAPTNGSITWAIMNWEKVEIRYPNEVSEAKRKKERFITMEQDQAEVEKMLKEKQGSHQYLVYEAAKLCKNLSGGRRVENDEILRYTLHMMAGAFAEDYVFAKDTDGNVEIVNDIIITNIRTREDLKRELEKRTAEMEIPSLLESLFRGFNRLYRKITNKPEMNPAGRPYDAHFYDPTREPGDRGLNILNDELKFQDALYRIQKYWGIASDYYSNGDKPNAYCALGHALHLICDLHVPAHVHNDMHGPTPFLGNIDSFERWVKKADYPSLQRRRRANIALWDAGELSPPKADTTWNISNENSKLEEFVNRIVSNTQRFRSVDAKDTDTDQQFTGKLSDQECYEQGSELIPSAMQNSAQLIANFYNCMNNNA
ncbi:MAG: hypothetical protein V1492_02665 [Candidatus Micrarchaeota archaeon]